MDSGNSGSLQSSSDADEEYDSRAAVDSVSAFFSGGLLSNPPTQAPPPQAAASASAAVFDPFSNYWQLHQNPNTAMPGSVSSAPGPRSDPNNNTIHQDVVVNPLLSTFSTPQELPSPMAQQNQNQVSAAARNPRKRSRASRRAPTTVLTTDTTNFRAMVQEFTGIPSPPFNSSPFSRTRFDPFGTRIGTSFDGAAAAGLPPPYLRRPLAQKIQSPLPQFLTPSSSHLSPPTAASTAIDASIPIPIPQINQQSPITKSSNLHSNPNPNPIFTSILQPNPKFPNLLESKSQPNSFSIFPSNDDPFPHLGHSNLLLSDHTTSNPNNADKFPSTSINGGFSFRTNGKANNFSSNSSTLNLGPENDVVPGRGEGMVESSWICSSSE